MKLITLLSFSWETEQFVWSHRIVCCLWPCKDRNLLIAHRRSLDEHQSLPPIWIRLHTCTHERTSTYICIEEGTFCSPSRCNCLKKLCLIHPLAANQTGSPNPMWQLVFNLLNSQTRFHSKHLENEQKRSMATIWSLQESESSYPVESLCSRDIGAHMRRVFTRRRGSGWQSSRGVSHLRTEGETRIFASYFSFSYVSSKAL